MTSSDFEINGKKFQGLVVPLPKAPLVLAKGQAGFVMCGYLNIEAAQKLGVAAALVRGVSTVDDLLNAPVQAVTPEAQALGVKAGMAGRDALACFA